MYTCNKQEKNQSQLGLENSPHTSGKDFTDSKILEEKKYIYTV